MTTHRKSQQINRLADGLQSRLTKLRRPLDLATYFLSDPKLPANLAKERTVRANAEAWPLNFPLFLGSLGWWSEARYVEVDQVNTDVKLLAFYKVHLAELISKGPYLMMYLLKN